MSDTFDAAADDPSETVPSVAIGPARADDLGGRYCPLRWFSSDGLVLAGRTYGDGASATPPVLCLPGLTRNARDFEPVAADLAGRGFRVIVAESRGRGQSQWDPNPAGYNARDELLDVLRLVDALRLPSVSVIGTSRGGILAMLMALMRPGLIARTVLNDIGPRIELAGLLKIKGYVGRGLGGIDWATAIAALAAGQGQQFPRLDRAGWERYARRLWRDDSGQPVNDYDPALAFGLAGLQPDQPLPEMWDAFAALAETPVLVLRGDLSDILSDATASEMARRHATVDVAVVPNEAHAPLLEDAPTLARIAAFLLA